MILPRRITAAWLVRSQIKIVACVSGQHVNKLSQRTGTHFNNVPAVYLCNRWWANHDRFFSSRFPISARG